MARDLQDFYFKQAKAEGYASRAAYKLIEIDERKKILRPGDRVLDCGCAPGSWLQVAAKRVGTRGSVVGIDLQPLTIPLASSVHALCGDLTTTPVEALLAPGSRAPGEARLFDVVLSDMAPNTSGDPTGDHHRSVRLCEAVLDRCPTLLRPGGNLVMKVFEGPEYPDLLKRMAAMFKQSKGFKPKASRSESTEMYIVAHDYRGPGRDAGSGTSTDNELAGLPARRRPPAAGWSTPR